MTILSDLEQEALVASWEKLHGDAAAREGWSIMDCAGSAYGRWQLQHFDTAPDGATQLATDDDAWRVVLQGCAAHHAAALALLEAVNPSEVLDFCRTVGSGLDVPAERVPLIVAASLSR